MRDEVGQSRDLDPEDAARWTGLLALLLADLHESRQRARFSVLYHREATDPNADADVVTLLAAAAALCARTGPSAATCPGRRCLREERRVGSAEMYLSAIATTLADQGIPAHQHVAVGNAAQGILQTATVYHPDVIIMSTHGLSGLRPVLLGSVAEHVLRTTDLPVLLVQAGHQTSVGPYHRILVPLDGTPGAERALQFVVQEEFARASEILLLHCEKPLDLSTTAFEYAYALGAASYIPQEIVDKLDEETRQHCTAAHTYLEDLAHRYLAEHPYRTYVSIGDPASTAVQLATESHVNLIVMTTHAHAGLDRLITGSVAAHVLGHAPAPVLFMRQEQEAKTPSLTAGRSL